MTELSNPEKVGKFYTPTENDIAILSGQWNCAFSGGKDSTSLVTWIEWLRRTGQIQCESPSLVRSDTTIEDALLDDIAHDLMNLLRTCGWKCAEVKPKIHEKMFNRILGIGNAPIHPGGRNMRWCTRATKIDPMNRYRKEIEHEGWIVTGLRWGESSARDEKIKKFSGCSAGGECGIPPPGKKTYSPLLEWKLCNIIDWLSGMMGESVRRKLEDIYPLTKRLIEIYNVKIGQRGLLDWTDPEVSMSRFGCIGCPAIASERAAPISVMRRYGTESPLLELYDVWYEARRRDNRCIRIKKGKDGRGPIRMSVRKRLFYRVLDIQTRAGVVLINEEDQTFIRQCWEEKRYPRGWSESDESTTEPTLF